MFSYIYPCVDLCFRLWEYEVLSMEGCMTKTYRELIQDRKNLDALINEARLAEIPNVVATIKGWIEEFGLTAEELGFKTVQPQKTQAPTDQTGDKVDKRKLPPKPKYANPNNPSETWSGRGSKDKRPQWVRDLIDGGGDIESCRIPE